MDFIENFMTFLSGGIIWITWYFGGIILNVPTDFDHAELLILWLWEIINFNENNLSGKLSASILRVYFKGLNRSSKPEIL